MVNASMRWSRRREVRIEVACGGWNRLSVIGIRSWHPGGVGALFEHSHDEGAGKAPGWLFHLPTSSSGRRHAGCRTRWVWQNFTVTLPPHELPLPAISM